MGPGAKSESGEIKNTGVDGWRSPGGVGVRDGGPTSAREEAGEGRDAARRPERAHLQHHNSKDRACFLEKR